MYIPTLKEERNLWRKGYRFIAGLDEVGRGGLAGPVVAAAVVVSPKFHMSRSSQRELRDSKKLSEKKREEFYRFFRSCPDMEWGIGIVSEKVIDRINILQATKLAMKKALLKLSHVEYAILDGNFHIDVPFPQKSIIRGDEKVFSCAVASIMAKVTRDRIMMKYHKKYPVYGFDRHKGYGTGFHIQALKRCGLSPIHRKSFILAKAR